MANMQEVSDVLGEWRWPDFKPWEIFSKGTIGVTHDTSLDKIKNIHWHSYRGVGLLDLDAMDKLQRFRNRVGRLMINNFDIGLTMRGIRSPKEQIEVIGKYKGAENSMHCAGKAFDLTPKDITLEELKREALWFGWGGVGYYPGKNFVHVDARLMIVDSNGKPCPVTWQG